MTRSITIFLFTALLFTSCIPYKSIPYFTDIPEAGDTTAIKNPYTHPTIQKNDILRITVNSISPEANAFFGGGGSQEAARGSYTTGSSYMVDQKGLIRLPLVGAVKVEGLTTWAIRDSLTYRLNSYLKDPLVEIRIESFRVAVLGAVGRPGMISVQNERLTLADAIALSGDLKTDARRNDILLIREEQGIRRQVRFDLSSRDVLNSPYYYLRSNDIIYVQPSRLASREINFRNLSYIATAISFALLIESVINRTR